MRGIYVERHIRTDFERLWRYTQSPPFQVRWDSRFSQITYLQRTLDGPERNRHIRKLPFGLRASIIVETTGIVNNDNGSRTSKVSFWSESAFTPLTSGTGYRRYVPVDDGYRYIEYLEYRMRFGPFGALAGAVLKWFFGREAARSVDTLALWLEDGVEPEAGRSRARPERCLRRPLTGQ